MNINGIELNRDQLWSVIQSQLEAAKYGDHPQAYKEVCAGVATAMTQVRMGDARLMSEQELVNLLRLES